MLKSIGDIQFDEWIERRKKDVLPEVIRSLYKPHNDIWNLSLNDSSANSQLAKAFYERLLRDLFDEKIILEQEKAESIERNIELESYIRYSPFK